MLLKKLQHHDSINFTPYITKGLDYGEKLSRVKGTTHVVKARQSEQARALKGSIFFSYESPLNLCSPRRVTLSTRTTFLNKTGPNQDSLRIFSRRKHGCLQIYTGITVDCEQSLFSSVRAVHARGSGEAASRAKRGWQPEKKRACLSRLAPSVTHVVICVSRVFCSTG